MRSSQKISPDASPNRLPWPIPPEGVCVEIARWWHGPTENRDAWWVVYRIRIDVERDEFCGNLYILRADSIEEGYFDRRERLRSFHGCWDVEADARGKNPPEKLVQAWSDFVERVRKIAQKEEQRYQRAVDSAW